MDMEGAGFDTTSSKTSGDRRRHVHSQADGIGKGVVSSRLAEPCTVDFFSVLGRSKIDHEGSHVVAHQFISADSFEHVFASVRMQLCIVS